MNLCKFFRIIIKNIEGIFAKFFHYSLCKHYANSFYCTACKVSIDSICVAWQTNFHLFGLKLHTKRRVVGIVAKSNKLLSFTYTSHLANYCYVFCFCFQLKHCETCVFALECYMNNIAFNTF